MDNVAYISAGAALGSALAVAVAKMMLQRGVRDLDRALELSHKINNSLAAIQVKVKNLEALTQRVHDHERRLIHMESQRIHASRYINNSDS